MKILKILVVGPDGKIKESGVEVYAQSGIYAVTETAGIKYFGEYTITHIPTLQRMIQFEKLDDAISVMNELLTIPNSAKIVDGKFTWPEKSIELPAIKKILFPYQPRETNQ